MIYGNLLIQPHRTLWNKILPTAQYYQKVFSITHEFQFSVERTFENTDGGFLGFSISLIMFS